MSLLKTNAAQIGQSVTATNNFTMYQPSSPDGTVRWGVGNSGSVTDIVTLNSSGNVGIGTITPGYLLNLNFSSTTLPTTGGGVILGLSNTSTSASAATSLIFAGTDTGGSFRHSGAIQWGKSGTWTAGSGNYGGYLAFWTRPDGGDELERMRIDSSGNVGIGTSSPGYKLDVAGSITASSSGAQFIAHGFSQGATTPTYTWGGQSAKTGMFLAGDNVIGWSTNATERMRIDSSGNVGIGTSSPSFTAANRTSVSINGTTDSVFTLNYGGTAGLYAQASSSDGKVYTTGTLPLLFGTGSTERMRIDSSGNILFNTTNVTAVYNGDGASYNPTGTGLNLSRSTTSAVNQITFSNPNGQVGFINTQATTTQYSTSSDYRLKENIQPMQNALAVVQQLNPVTYTWKADGSDGQGFIAHELQAVVPDCVTGEKDGVDDNGNPVYQGIDTSFLVATLTAAIKELTARVIELEKK